MNIDNASYTFRGFRLQTLYIIYKIFTSPKDYYFQPEGAEDLAVFSEDRKIIEAIQVKSGDSNFVLSDLKSSFFERSIKRQHLFPDIKLSLIKFGPVGNQLTKACENDGSERKNVINKLLERPNARYDKEELNKLFASIETETVDEATIVSKIEVVLRDSMTSVDVNATFDLLSMWINYASEQQLIINQSILQEKVISIGKYLNGRKVYHDQWFTVIQPLENNVSETIDKETLATSYYQGEAARFIHITSGLDVVRAEKLEEIHRLLTERNVLFVHGVSGQGKSTLLYRYLYDYYPDTWRFQIKSIEGRNDALKSAHALAEHAKALNVPIIVFLDISANDRGWEEVIKSLSIDQNIQILVAIREEDWKQARVAGVEFLFHEIELKFDETEAQQIFNILFERGLVKKHNAFSEAWEEFGGKGPLLEFVYLITQGGKLEERLRSQVDRLIDEALPNDNTLNVLRAIAVATASGSSLSVEAVVEHFNITVPQKTFKRLEAEYLLRLDTSKQWISAVHPIRSILLERILIDEGFAPWIKEVQTVLPLLCKNHVGQFLLYTFLNHFEQRYEILNILDTYKPNTLEATEGIVGVLVWLSVREFIEQKRDYLQEIFNTREGNFVLALGADIAQIGNNEWADVLQKLNISEDFRKRCQDIYDNLSIKNFKFNILTHWLEKHKMGLANPTTNSEWLAFANICFWLWKCELNNKQSIPINWKEMQYDDSLSLNTISLVTTTLYYAYPSTFKFWSNLYRSRALKYLEEEELVYAIEIKSDMVKAHFISLDLRLIDEEKSEDSNKNLIHEKTIRIINYLRLLFPDKSYYGSQGYGHLGFGFEIPDESIKNIPKESLPLQELVNVNAIFRRTVNNLFRPSEWQDYIEKIILTRQKIVNQLNSTVSILNQYFQSKKAFDPLHKNDNIDEWLSFEDILRDKYLLPSSIVDPLGFSDENSNTKAFSDDHRVNLASIRYSKIQKHFSSYLSDLHNFITQAATVFEINGVIGKYPQKEQIVYKEQLQESGINLNAIHLSWINLQNARMTLPLLQQEFHKLFEHTINEKQLRDLEQEEEATFQKVGYSWYFFVHNAYIVTKSADKEFTNRFEERKNQVLKNFIKYLNTNEIGSTYSVFPANNTDVPLPFLWIKVSHHSSVNAWHGCFEAILRANEFIRNQSYFSQTVMKWYWSNMRFVPEYNGFSVSNVSIPYNVEQAIYLGPDEEIKPIWYIPEDLSNHDLNMLGLQRFESPLTAMILKMHESISRLMMYLLHLKEFKKCLDPDTESGEEMLHSYTKQLNNGINDSLNSSINKIEMFLKAFKEFEEINKDEYIAVSEALLDLYDVVFPHKQDKDTFSITLDEIDSWAIQLRDNLHLIMSTIFPLTMELSLKRRNELTSTKK